MGTESEKSDNKLELAREFVRGKGFKEYTSVEDLKKLVGLMGIANGVDGIFETPDHVYVTFDPRVNKMLVAKDERDSDLDVVIFDDERRAIFCGESKFEITKQLKEYLAGKDAVIGLAAEPIRHSAPSWPPQSYHRFGGCN